MLAAGRALGPGSVGRGLGYGLAGQLLGAGVKQFYNDPNSEVDDALAGAARWGGAGAGVGSMIAPGLGTVIGGAAGGVFGAGKALLGGNDDPRSNDALAAAKNDGMQRLNQLLTSNGFTDQSQQQIMLELAIGLGQATDANQIKAVFANAEANLPAYYQQDLGLREQQRTEQYRAAQTAAVLSMLGPQLQQQNQDATQFSKELSTIMGKAAGAVSDPTLKSIYEARAAQIPLQQSLANQAMLQQLAAAHAAYSANAQSATDIAQQQQAIGNQNYAAEDANGLLQQLIAGR
jgi:hypothetical protein